MGRIKLSAKMLNFRQFADLLLQNRANSDFQKNYVIEV